MRLPTFVLSSSVLALGLGACVERPVLQDSLRPVRAESFEIPFVVPELPQGSTLQPRLHRLHELVQQGLYDEAKHELASLNQEPDAQKVVETLERWDRYLDGCLAWESLHGSASPLGASRVGVGRELAFEFQLFTSGATLIDIPVGGIEDTGYAGADETSFFKLRVTEVVFDALGARRSTVRWETVPLREELRCVATVGGSTTWTMPPQVDTGWSLKLIRVDAVLYPCAARVGSRYVPMRPLPFDSTMIAVYPNGWERLLADPLLALRAACASEDPIYDRHVLIAASLLERGGDAERSAYALLESYAAQGSPRARVKARTALDWLRLDARSLWSETTQFAPVRAKSNRRTNTLQLPAQR